MNADNDVAVKTLAKYLRENLPVGFTVYEEWPDPKDKLEMPCISLMALNKPMVPSMISVHSQADNEENPDQIDTFYNIGQYDFSIQLDLWNDYKAQRGTNAKIVDDVLNKQFLNGDASSGLSLTLEDYAEVIARYDNVGYTYPDSEEASQRSEWRVKFEILVNHSKVVKKTESRMKEITIKQKVSESNTDVEETITLQE